MIKLDTSRCETLVRASIHAKANPSRLSEFELELLWTINMRALGGDTIAECTFEEWAAIEQVVDLLQADILDAQIVPAKRPAIAHPALQIP